LYSRPKKDIKKIENVLYTTQVDYDAQSRPSKITYPGGLAVKNIYNAYGLFKRGFDDLVIIICIGRQQKRIMNY
jgi:hypothetical protein